MVTYLKKPNSLKWMENNKPKKRQIGHNHHSKKCVFKEVAFVIFYGFYGLF
jgi:hypothetical protein